MCDGILSPGDARGCCVQAEAKAVAEQLASVEKALSTERELSKQVGGWVGLQQGADDQ